MQRKLVILLVALTVTVAVGATTVAATDHANVTVEQEPGETAIVTVTDGNNSTVQNATVTVSVIDENATYVGTNENYSTDENGTVELPAPNETVEVNVTATVDNETVSTNATLEAVPELEVNVTQTQGEPASVLVTADGEPAENASVTVSVDDENATYVATNETYTTDENGTVELPTPNETVNVTVTATLDGAEASTNATLEAVPDLDVSVSQDGPGLPATVTVLADGEPAQGADVTVSVDSENGTYEGTGTYQTDENGTVELPAPNETVTLNVTVSYEGAEKTTTVTLEGTDAIDEDQPFGQQVQQFKLTLNNSGGYGQELAVWVVENNPGNAPDHAGPKAVEDVLNETASDDDDERGPPEGAGNGGGPPDDAGNGNGHGSGNGNGNGGGPPDEKGNGNGNSNGNGNGNGGGPPDGK